MVPYDDDDDDVAITNPTRYVLAEMHRCCNEGGGGDKTKAPSVSLVTIRRLGIGTGGDCWRYGSLVHVLAWLVTE